MKVLEVISKIGLTASIQRASNFLHFINESIKSTSMDRDHYQQTGEVESDIESDEEDDDSSDTSKVTGGVPRQHAEDAFSSSSEDDDVPPLRRQVVRRITPASSEFDKALLSGIPSIGAASFDGSEFTPEIDMTVMPHPQEASEDGKSTASEEMSFSQVSRKTKISKRLLRFPGMENSHFRQNLATNHASASTSGLSHSPSISSQENTTNTTTTTTTMTTTTARPSNLGEDFSNGVLPDVLMSVRQKIESMSLFDSDMMKLVEGAEQWQRESLKRSTQQSLSAAVLVSLAHKRYERRRLAAMEIEKVVRGLVQQQEIDRIRSILLLLSDDYVRSTSEDARKGGVVALAACGIGLKKAGNCPKTKECRDLILASVVHACQDHSQRVRYYATESLFNVVKINPTIAVQHFFILFEILRSLFADVDVDVRSGAELLDKKLKEVIVGAINSGSFSVDACVPIFGRFIYMRNKATQRLTLTWLQELNEKLVGNPVLEFLHLFLGGIFAMIADPNNQIRQSALAFLQSVLPKLLMTDNQIFEDQGASMKMDFDKLIQSLVTTLEHPDPFVRKVAMYWMSRIVKAYIGDVGNKSSPATISVRNSVPHVLPGILLSIGDTFHSKVSTKDSFLPDQTTHSLAQQTNICLQTSVKKDGNVYVTHLDGFIVALREELDSPGRDSSAAIERKQYRLDMTTDGSGIESTGWFRVAKDRPKNYEEEATSKSRLCALEWITVLYEHVVPDVLKADFSREFINPIIHQITGNPPELIIRKSLEVLAKITVPVAGEPKNITNLTDQALSALVFSHQEPDRSIPSSCSMPESPMTNLDAAYALEILDARRSQYKSRDRAVFTALIQLHSHNHQLLEGLSRVIQIMCSLQPPEFVFVSFAIELDAFIAQAMFRAKEKKEATGSQEFLSPDLAFVSSFIQQMSNVLLVTNETNGLRELLRDCIGKRSNSERDKRRVKLFHILLHSFAHNLMASTALCLWAGAYRSATYFLQNIHPLDIHLIFLLELDRLVELLERPLFRHLHLRMLEADDDPKAEGSGSMLFRILALLLMIVPQSTCYYVLRDRLMSLSRFRHCTLRKPLQITVSDEELEAAWIYASHVTEVRQLHCDVAWDTIRSESLETFTISDEERNHDMGSQRRDWLGFANEEEEMASKIKAHEQHQMEKFEMSELRKGGNQYHDIEKIQSTTVKRYILPDSSPPSEKTEDDAIAAENDEWKSFWKESVS